MITRGFRLNALANKYVSVLHSHIIFTSGGNYSMVDADGEAVRMEIVNGVKGVRSLVDSYTLAATKVFYLQWEAMGIELLDRCVTKGELTGVGCEIWQSMINDMGATVAGGSHAWKCRNGAQLRNWRAGGKDCWCCVDS